jgi:hypothetical protein
VTLTPGRFNERAPVPTRRLALISVSSRPDELLRASTPTRSSPCVQEFAGSFGKARKGEARYSWAAG